MEFSSWRAHVAETINPRRCSPCAVFGVISALNRAINQAFAEAGISIAFPQRDLHLDTTRPLQIELTEPGIGTK